MTMNLAARVRDFGAASLRNFGWGCKAALLLRVDPDRIDASPLQLCVAALLVPLLAFTSQFLEVGDDGEFAIYGMAGACFPVAVLLLVACLSAHWLDERRRVLPLLLLLLNACIAIDLAALLVQWVAATRADDWPRIAALDDERLGPYWLAVAASAAVAWLRPSPRAFGIAAVLALLVAGALGDAWRSTALWSPPYDETASEDNDAAVAEDVLYGQPDLLDQALERLQPGTGDSAHLYFLGVAGDASQAVFRRELRSFDQLFLARFTQPQQNLLLINNRHTLHTDPIASVTAMQAAIDRFAEVMNLDRDILFIYLTSHGSRERGLALDFAPLRLNDLGPETLRKMLDEAGIRWRVVVVSACYSGIFVPVLADEHTLVITASASDRTSFGCADENDFTYFGRAYFDALGSTDSFVDAFTAAKAEVAKREGAEHEAPSKPQIAIGALMRDKLETFAASRHKER